MNGPPSSNPQLQAGLIPHFAMASDSSMGLTAHHSLAAYGIMHHQPLGMGRVPSNPPNDMGPPIFMPCESGSLVHVIALFDLITILGFYNLP